MHEHGQAIAELENSVAKLENVVALLKLEKEGIRQGYTRVKAELDRRKGLKPGHTIVRDRPDMDYPEGKMCLQGEHANVELHKALDAMTAQRDKYKAVADAIVDLESDQSLSGAIRMYKLRAEASVMESYRDMRLAVVAALEALPKDIIDRGVI